MFDDQKVRRNLVGASATVLATYYVGLPIGEIVTEQLIGKGYAVDSLKFTELGFVLFVYLGLMFRFSETGLNYSAKVTQDGPKLAKARAMKWAINAVRSYLTDRTEPSRLFKPGLVESLAEIKEKKPSDFLGSPHNVFLHQTETVQSPSSFQADLNIHWTPNMNSPGNETGSHLKVELSRNGVFLLKVLTFLERHFYTETAIQTLLPILLGNAAVTLMVYKVLGLYLATS